MITYLKVRNLAIVEEFEIEPGAGLNVLTGETGAGKSLLIDSLELLRGARSSSEMIRAGADKMTAEAVFHLPASVRDALGELSVDVDEGDGEVELVVRREVAAGGRGRVIMNGSPVAVRELGAAMDAILEVHGQNESHQRVAGQTFRELLDDYAENTKLCGTVADAYASWRAASEQLDTLRAAERDRALRIDLLRYQVDEIAAARLDPDEEEALRGERTMLAHARELGEATAGAYKLLEEEEGAAVDQVGRALHLLQPLAKDIAEVQQLTEELQDVLYRMQEAARAVSGLADSIRHDPARLEEVEDRLVTIERLKKKYGGAVAAVLEHLETSRTEFEQLSDFEASREKLERAELNEFERYRKAAEKLSLSRKRAALALQTAIQNELNDLAMERTTVRVAVDTATDRDSRLTIGGEGVAFNETGFDRIEILIAPNRGEEPKAMQRIASGGELSRIQLAIAAALFKSSPNPAAATLVFDEVDAGIGGRVAEVVGRKLQELARRSQVICVTHLPQIASFGSTHFHVWKEDVRGHTVARIRHLENDRERVEEIARMLAGESVTASARTHAKELLQRAQQ